MPRWSFLRRRRAWATVAGISVCGLVAAIAPVAASAAAPSAASCPEAFPQEEVTKGMEVSGLTVSSGTEPDELTGKVTGVLEDGIAPGMDMIIVRMSGSEITDPDTGDVWRGIWAGMSGSPVYTSDGRLLGAVAYGLSYSPSDYAGITPAAEMYNVRDYESSGGATPTKTAKVPAGLAKDLAKGGATEEQIEDGFRRLPMPMSVSGLSDKRLQQVSEKFDRPTDRFVSGNGSGANEEPTPIEAGGNLAASLSYGDVSQIGTGTTTAVCDDGVLGFGHSMLLSGKSTMSMHGAEALYIETDVFDGSSKISNPTAPVGQITQDRTAAILGKQGQTPDAVTVNSNVSATNGNQRDGSTTMTQKLFSDDVPWIAATHLLANEDRVFDQYGAGSGTVKWNVEMERADGSKLEFSRVENYVDRSDLTYGTVDDVYQSISRIENNSYEKVRVTNVEQEASLDDKFQAYELDRVERLKDGNWLPLAPGSTTTKKAGTMLELKAFLVPRKDSIGQPTVVRLSIKVGQEQGGRTGKLVVSGGADTKNPVGAVDTLPDYLKKLSKNPRDNRVFGMLTIDRPGTDWKRRDFDDSPSHTTGKQSFTVNVK